MFAAFVGLHEQVDERLQYHSDRRCFLSSLLQYSVQRIIELDASQDGGAVAELRGYTHEFPSESRYSETAHQGDAAQAVQRHGSWDQVGDGSLIVYLLNFLLLCSSFSCHDVARFRFQILVE